MFEDITKSNMAVFAGLALASLALPALLPNLRPTLRSALKIGVDLLTESELEAEAELVEALVSATVVGIQQDLSDPTTRPERSEAVQKRVEHFKHQARARARRWARDSEDGHRRYRRHVARLEASLAKQKQHAAQQDQQILDYAFAALGSEA